MRDRRLELMPGYTCNNNCRFCYVAHERKKHRDKTTEELKKDIRASRERGTKEIAFLGGEPTIRPDIVELIEYAKKLGFNQIKITTNGRMFYYPEFTQKVIEAGLTKVLFSVHGHNSELHDYLTRSPGSFEQLLKGIKNVKRFNIAIESNTTITRPNYKFLPQIAKFLSFCEMVSSEFIFVFPYGNSLENFSEIVPSYSEIEPYLHQMIDAHRGSKTKILVRYIPFCFMQGYEKYVAELYDPPEREQVGPGIKTLDVISARKKIDRRKPIKCKPCKYYSVCEGPWSLYSRFRGSGEFEPVIGESIKDVRRLME